MKRIFVIIILSIIAKQAFAQSEPSTYFNVYVPPNNEAINRNVALIVTAISDSTSFNITDDDMDGDKDDSVSGILMAGQSYILYIKDNGINDDAQYASGGTLTRDGDYYIINSNQLVYASMATDSDWQHDFVPAVNKKSVGQKFYVYAPKVSSSPRDLNVFAYHENTTISIFKISTAPTLQTGYTNIDLGSKKLVVQKTVRPGQDIIHFASEGRDVMESGGTYLIEANKDVSVQYGALSGNARDGGAYVPSSNGSASGELFYFAVPYQNSGEQEIRIASWDNNNQVQLSRFNNGSWVIMNTWTLNELQPADWVGKQNGNATFPTVFRVTCSPGKRVSVMEANWMETGSTNTSDMSTMLSAESGTSSGKRFLAYMLPPSRQNNVVNPFNGKLFEGSITHFYLFAGSKNTIVTVKDAKTNGQVLRKTYEIQAGRYADAFFTMDEWKSIYNGTGTPVGPERPYVTIEATENIAVLSTNFNDNWMSYFGSSLPQSFTQTGNLSSPVAKPGDEIKLVSDLTLNAATTIQDAEIKVNIASGLIPQSSTLKKNGDKLEDGRIESGVNGSTASFNPVPVISGKDKYSVETSVIVAPTYDDGVTIPNGVVLSIETVVSGTVDGEFQQSNLTQGIRNDAANTSNLLFSLCQINTIASTNNNSWNLSWADYNNDGHEDLFIATKDVTQNNELYRNNGNNTFTRITNHPLVNEKTNAVAAVWADINNDGRLDVLLVNATQHPSKLFINNGSGNFTEQKNSGIDQNPQYFHGAAFADFDNDGYVDLIMTNFFSTRFHQLYRNNGNNTFSPVTNTPVTLESERSMAPVLADYNNDGLVDVFIPNGNNRPNALFKNLGNFRFEKVNDAAIQADAKNSVGAAWGDINNDGFFDLMVVNASNQRNDLYLNKGDGTFQKMDSSLLSIDAGDSHSAAWLDVNNDGKLDLLISNDQGSSFLYLGDGSDKFSKKIGEIITGNLGKSYGVAVGDHNRDGQLDVAVSTHTSGATRYFCHNGTNKNWIGFRLRGEFSNKQALGARVAIKSNGQWQYRQNLPVSGFGSQHSQNIHFGIDGTSNVDSVIISWPSGAVQVLGNFKVNQYNQVLEEAQKVLKGTAFHDLNSNGIRDLDEPTVANLQLKINDGQMVLATSESGQFELRTNNENVKITSGQARWIIKPEYALLLFRQGTQTLEVNLPVNSVANGYDLGISVATTAWRRGFTNESVIQVSNSGTTKAENVQVQLTLPQEAYLISSSQIFSSPKPKTYIWALGTLEAGAIAVIPITDSIGLVARTGDILLLQANTSASGTDLNADNNSHREEIEVVGAIDPNDILVSPRGDGPQGFINKNQLLTYTIRFENLGTFKATYVRLINQLPAGLDYSSLEILSASHPFTYSLDANGKLDVFFRNIDLPAAQDDSLGANGYLKYRISPLPTVIGGTQLANQAKIFFDFEDPIITNTVVNTIKYEGSNEVRMLALSPNPASDLVNIAIDADYFQVTEPQVIASYAIVDYSGKTVLKGIGNFSATMVLNIAGIPAGMYIIQALDPSGQSYAGKLLKK